LDIRFAAETCPPGDRLPCIKIDGSDTLGKEQLKKMALAAEIIGGAAVIVTLVFLVVETRENTRAVQAQSYLALTSELNRIREKLFEPEVASIFSNAILDRAAPESPRDALIYRQIFEAAFSIYEAAYYAKQKGVLDGSEWSRFDEAMCRNMSNVAPIWEQDDSLAILGQGVRSTLTEPFVNYVEDHCDWATVKAEFELRANMNE